MAKKEFNLTGIEKGYNISWYVCTQTAANPVFVKLYDNEREYFSIAKKDSNNAFKIWSQGHSDFMGDTLKLQIDIPNNPTIKQSNTSSLVLDSVAQKVGQVYAFTIEDATDEDFNDIYVNIVAWAKKG